MKLILKQYLSSLRERGELDAILPDLLSQLGLNVFSRPGRGTRQDGVDVGAVGSLDEGQEKVYLFSIKAGNLTRNNWDSGSEQSLRPSLNEIIDVYIPHRLPVQHREKDIVICICIGGDVQEQVRQQLTGFIEQNTKDKITFQEWNGDNIASLILSCFLREDLLPEHAQSSLRKSLSLLDEPEASFYHFKELINSLSVVGNKKYDEQVSLLRQMSICLWILFSWARENKNMEAAYLSGELTLLHGWKIYSPYATKRGKRKQAIETTFFSIFSAYQQICNEFLSTNIIPHVGKLHALSSAVRASCNLDINLKLFDLLGRLTIQGIWACCGVSQRSNAESQKLHKIFQLFTSSAKDLISNNPALLLPMKDDQAIDIFIAAFLLALDKKNHDYIIKWFAEMIGRASFAYQVHGHYPCNLRSYSELLSHPQKGDDEYRKNVTSGSILYPIIALWSALLDDEETYQQIVHFKQDHLQHCNFQLWYPDECSEAHFYTNDDLHGSALSDVCVDRPKEEFLAQVFGECDQSPHFKEMCLFRRIYG